MIENIDVNNLIKKIGIDFKQHNSIDVSTYGKWQKDFFQTYERSWLELKNCLDLKIL